MQALELSVARPVSGSRASALLLDQPDSDDYPQISVPPPPHLKPGWDMHEHSRDLARPERDRLAPGTAVSGTVVCHHHFGLGMYIDDSDDYGHVNITAVAPGRIRGPEDFPPIGSSVSGTVLGYSGDQLRIALWQGVRG